MQALLLSDYRKLELVSMDSPALGPRDVLVRVAACGICGSDVHGYDGSSGRRIPPIVMGHEAAGTVVEVGAEVDRERIGDRVTFDSTISCGECEACREGQVNLCGNRRVFGVSCDEYRQHGAYAEFVAVPQNILYPLPPELPFEHAALIEPVSVALHAVDLLKVRPGERAVVVGSGMIGLLVIQALRVAGCRDVIAVDIDAGRLQLARELGATHTIDSKRSDAIAAVLELTNGRGAELAVEVVGNSAALSTAVRSVAAADASCLSATFRPKCHCHCKLWLPASSRLWEAAHRPANIRERLNWWPAARSAWHR